MLKLAREVMGAQVWQGAILLCTVLIQLAVARYAGATALGITTIIVSSSALCILLIELNLQSALVRAIATADETGKKHLRDGILSAKLHLALTISPVVAAFVGALSGHDRATIFFGTIAAVVAQQSNPAWWLQGEGRTNQSFMLSAWVAVIACVVALPIVMTFKIPGSENLTFSLVGILIYGGYWKITNGFAGVGQHAREKLREYVRFAGKHRSFLLGGAAIYLYLYPAQLLLAYLRSPADAGMYRVAIMPGAAYYAVTVAAYYAYYPMIVRAFAAGPTHYRKTVGGVVLLVAGVGFAACLVSIAIQGLLLRVVGENFEPGVSLSPLLMASKAVGGIGLVLRAALLADQMERVAFFAYFMIGLGALAAHACLIPAFGILGAAAVEIAQETIHLLVLVFILLKKQGIRPATTK